ncbi:helix-turn-helix transcriptional regulator [Fodinibius sediminis]|uniref:Transcriptional regulator, LuxR family n=1 Tax=Fodinibius sediminis TaxID=1214077 RepID=A0A521AR09_9BACT|nr:helix-turn-helix transcriptional regulator [Fodinibius sediminis]SMO37080.1 transcriptional regulator, LuxR family [Fodinibius sediminis]
MNTANILEQGRQAFRHQSWGEAYTRLSSAKREIQLEAKDLELLARAAYLTGRIPECIDIWTGAHHRFIKQGDTRRAAACAFWVGMVLFNQGERAQGGGWMARARRLIAEKYEQDCAEAGFLMIPEALHHLRKGQAESAHKLFSRAADIGKNCDNRDLLILGRLGRGQALIQQNEIARGTTLFDEIMVGVVSDEVSPMVAGIVYCAVIESCQKIYDLPRAHEWTKALGRWCDSQPDLIPYRGECLVRRAEIMQLHGEWREAMRETEQACDLFQTYGSPASGEAFYRQAELFRLQGNFNKAEDKYREASKWGRKPQPGLALLRLGQGEIGRAQKAIRRVEEEKQDWIDRSAILPAYVRIMIAADEIRMAQTAARELSEIASKLHAPFLEAVADRALGSVLLADNKPSDALHKLHHAGSVLKEMEALYESAQTRLLIGLACRKLGDMDTAEIELDAARWMFQQLGATPDASRIDALLAESSPGKRHGLTPRELEVLRYVATGKTNKTIAGDLFISERTVDRHVSNILAKLNLPSRAAATAYAYEHDLI